MGNPPYQPLFMVEMLQLCRTRRGDICPPHYAGVNSIAEAMDPNSSSSSCLRRWPLMAVQEVAVFLLAMGIAGQGFCPGHAPWLRYRTSVPH